MSKFFLKLGHFLVFSKKTQKASAGHRILFANFLLLASIVFIVEVILFFSAWATFIFP